MPRVSNSAEGGVDGVTVTTLNSNGISGEEFDDVNLGGGTIVFDAANALFGSMSYAIDPVALATTYLGYGVAIGTQTDIFGRLYVKFPTLPTTVHQLVVVRNSVSVAECASISVTNGILSTRDASGAVLSSTGSILTANSTFRVEWHFIGNVSAGTVEAKVFLTPNSTTPSATLTNTSANTRGSFDRFRVGYTDSSPSNLGVVYVDELVWDTAAYPGPASYLTSPTLLDGTATLFTPKANESLTPGLLSQAPTPFTPNVRTGINVGLIDQTPVLYAFGQRQVVGGGGAFQPDAFQGR